jgi:hypothetical protein
MREKLIVIEKGVQDTGRDLAEGVVIGCKRVKLTSPKINESTRPARMRAAERKESSRPNSMGNSIKSAIVMKDVGANQ